MSKEPFDQYVENLANTIKGIAGHMIVRKGVRVEHLVDQLVECLPTGGTVDEEFDNDE